MAFRPSVSSDTSPCPVFDVQKVHVLGEEQQRLALLTFASDLRKHVSALDADGAKAQQEAVKEEIIKIITLKSPEPTRVIRNNIGACLAGIFNKGDRKILYGTIHELLAIVNKEGKAHEDLLAKHAAVHCLGAVFDAAGDSAISLSALVCSSILALYKTARKRNTGLCGSLLRGLGRIIKGVGNSIDRATASRIASQARSSATSNDGRFVQTSACWCLEQLHVQTLVLDNRSDYDRTCAAIWDAMETPSPALRNAAASCWAAILLKSYNPNTEAVAKPKKTKKAKTKALDADEVNGDSQRPSSPAPATPVPSLAFGLQEMLRQLSNQYCQGIGNKARSAIASCYSRIVQGLDPSVVQLQYKVFAKHFFEDLLNSATIFHHRYRLLKTRKLVRLILGDIIGQTTLTESSQHDAIKYLVNEILKDYPQSDVKERPEPSKQAIIGALDVLVQLIQSLGIGASADADMIRDALLQVLVYPSHSVQVHTSRCLQALVRACPQQLLPIASSMGNGVSREIAQLTSSRQSPRRCQAYAYGLAAVISTANEQPLYGSLDVYSNILTQATGILKNSSGSDLRLSSTQIQVAWMMLTSLMTLGPDFVKAHLPQLFLLWKNALPPPLTKENIGQRSTLELSFLTHVREWAVSSISCFLHFNSRLLTLDVSKRLTGLMQNTTSFLSSISRAKSSDDADNLLNPQFQLSDYEALLRRRLFTCYAQLFRQGPEANQDAMLQSSIVNMTIAAFANPSIVSIGRFSATITSSGSIWDAGDSSDFGLTGLFRRPELASLFLDQDGRVRPALDVLHDKANPVHLFDSPVASDIEHDTVQILVGDVEDLPDALPTSVVNCAIGLFAQTLVHQSPSIQQAALQQLSSNIADLEQRQSIANRQAITINIVVALLLALDGVSNSRTSATFSSSNVQKAFQRLLNAFILNPDIMVRSFAAEALGRLCRISGIDFATHEITYLIDMIVSNRAPHARSGCAAALGCLHSQMGGMAAGMHLKNIIGVLSSLAKDPHPTVHFAAIDALSRVANSAGLAFTSNVPQITSLLAQLYVLDSHNEETATERADVTVELETPTTVARSIDSMINALGPDLQDSSSVKVRDLLLTLTYQFQMEHSSSIKAESLRCIEHMFLYASAHISRKPYIRQLQERLLDPHEDVRDVALAGIFNLMRRGAEEVLATADPSLEQQLWLLMHETHGRGIIHKLMRDWVEQSGLSHIALWITRIQRVLTTSLRKTHIDLPKHHDEEGKEEEEDGELPLQDEEVAGFNAASRAEKNDPENVPDASPELLRWQARYEAMSCLNFMLAAVAKEVESNEDSHVLQLLQPRVGDVVRIAFSASTASVVDIRVEGIKVIGKMLEIFGHVPDPDFTEATLLEQYQAQISSALTPAFATDSSPVLAAEAVNVCAVFISTGIVTDAERMGRILKVLISALDDLAKDGGKAAIGDLKDLSPSAAIMVRLALLSAWASLQVASREQHYLKDILKPHLEKLTPLWLAALREYASLKFEPEVSSNSTFASGLDMVHSALTRRAILRFYQASWLRLVEAIASLIDEDSDFVFDALDGNKRSATSNGGNHQDISYRDEPLAFFFILFGITFEALVRTASQPTGSRQRMLDVLQALKEIVSPAVAGKAIYQGHIFSECMDLLDRLALTEGIEVQAVIVEIARNLCRGHPSGRRPSLVTEADGQLSDDIEQMFELTRIIVLVISSHVPNLSPNQPVRRDLPESAATLVVHALDSLVDAAYVFPMVIRSDLHACILHVFSVVFASAACQEILVPSALPIFRRFLAGMAKHPLHDTASQLRSALARLLAIVKTAQRRETAASYACEKNALLAATILISTCASLFPAQDALLDKFVDELVDCLNNRITTKVTAGISRSILLLPYQQRKTGDEGGAPTALSSKIMPHLINFLVNSLDIEQTDQARTIIASSITGFAIASPSDAQKITASSIAISALLRRAEVEGNKVYGETAARFMDLGGAIPSIFRTVVAALSAEQRSLLDQIIRNGAGPMRRGQKNDDDEAKEPTIALKLDF